MKKFASSPRILYLTPPWPYRSIRSLHVARALRQMGQVEVVVADSVCGGVGSVENLGTEFKLAYELPVRVTPPQGLASKLRRFVDPRYPDPHGLGVDEDGERRLLQTLREFDLVWIFKLRTANMFRRWRWPGSVLDVDDLPSGVLQTVRRSSGTFRQRFQAGIQALRWRRRERLLGERFSVLTVCSEADKHALQVPAPVHVVPSGYELSPVDLVRHPGSPPRIGFIGLFDYAPNVEGVRWFVRECWPRLKQSLPDARLRLVGRGSREAFGTAGKDIDALGWIDDSDGEIATWSAMIVPLHVGGGTRVKIAEGFSRKCPIVSTRVGAFGYEVQNGRELLLVDDPQEFASACVRLIQNPAEADQMAQRAFAAFLEKWTWDAIAPRIWAAAEDCLRRRHGG